MEYKLQDQGQINIDFAARERMASFRFRFGSSPVNPSSNANLNSSSPLTTGTNFNIPTTSLDTSPNVTPTRTSMAPAKTHGRSSSHSRSHSRSGSLPTTCTLLPLKPSTMNIVPHSLPNVNVTSTTLTRQSPPASTSNIGPTYDTSQIASAPSLPAPAPRSRPGSHHKRRSSVSTRRESAELMGITFPPECSALTGAVTDSDTTVDGRRMALWALEGKGKASRRPDFIGGYTKVEIPELNETTLNLGNADENEPPTISSSKVNRFDFNHNSFPPLGSSSSSKRDSLPAFTLGGSPSSMSVSSGKRDSLPSFGLGCATGGNKRDSFPSFNNGFGLGMGISSVNKRDSFGKFLSSCLPSDQLGTLVEEEEDVEEDAPIDELEDLGVEEDEEEDGDETFRADTHEVEDDEDDEYAEEHEDKAEGDVLQAMDLDEDPLPHAHLYPQNYLLSKISALAPMSTSTPISPPISVPVSTDISISRVTASSTPVIESTPTPTAMLSSTRPRPANLNLNFSLRPLSLTPDSLPLNTRAASISASPSFNDTPISNAGSAAYTPSPRVSGLRQLSLVAAASSPAGSVSTQSPLTRRTTRISSSSSNTSGSTSSISYRRSPLSVESESSSSVASSSEVHSSRPNHQYATLRRTSQSHLPTPGATPTSAVPPSLLGLPFGIGMVRENCEEEEDHTETSSQTCAEMERNDTQAENGEDIDGDASTPTGPASTANTTRSGSRANLPELDRPLSPTEQAFLFRSHTSLLGRISELEEIISQKTLENRDRSRSRGLSPGGSDISAGSLYGRRHGRFESSASSVSTNTSLDTTSASTSEPSDELLRLITDLKSERDSLMHDLQTYQSRIAELEKTITTLTRRVEAERRESWVAQERMSVLEIERRRAAEEVSKLEDVVKDLRDKVADFERVKTALIQEKERISTLESHVEAVRHELDNEKARSCQVEDEAGLLRKQVERMTGEMDALRALVAEQHAQILQFQQMQMQTKRVASIKNYNGSHNSFASTSASDSLSFSNAHSHMSSSSTLAVDVDVEAEVGDDVGQYKYVPVGMSPPRSHATRAILGSVAEAEEDTVITDHHHHHHLADDDDVPRDITADESEDDEDHVTAEDEDELAHYEDASEYDEDEDEDGHLDDDEDGEEVVWGEDITTSSFGDFVPRRGISNALTSVPSTGVNSFPARPAHGHARLGSMEKGWSFAAARANAAQAQSLPMLGLTPNSKTRNLNCGIIAESKKKTELPKVDRFFECLDALEDEDEDNSPTAKIEFSDAKSFWSSAVRQHDEYEDEMDLPPFLLPTTGSNSSASDSTSPSSLNMISEEDEEDESSTHLATPAPTPSWKDLLAASLDAVAEEDEEYLEDEEDDYPPSPSLRPTLTRNARVQSLLPQHTSTSALNLAPPTTALSQMTPNTLKTTLDATVRSPRPASTNSNRWNIVGASLGLGFPSNKSMTTPVKTRSTFSSSTSVNDNLLPTPPPTLIPRLSSKSGLSSPASPKSPSPAPSVSPVPSSVPSPISNEFVDQGWGRSTTTIVVSKYSTLSPSRIPTPSKKNLPKERGIIGSGFIPAITASAATVGTATSSATVESHFVFHEISHAPYSASHQGEGPGSGSRAGLDSDNDNKGTLVTHCNTGKVDGVSVPSRSRLRLDVDTRSLRTPELPIDLQSSSNSSLSPTFGGFAARLKTFWKRGGNGYEDDLPRQLLSSTPRSYASPTNRPPAYVSRVKQVEALRMRLEKESQGCRTQDEVMKFIGCSQCADPTIIVL